MSERIQKALVNEGFDPGPIDGVRGAKTKAALQEWQQWAMQMPKGIDISHYQTKIDWPLLAKEISFIAIRASVSTGKDKLFTQHWQNAKSVGLLRGAYHFFAPWRDAKTQAALLWSRIENDPGELPPVLDVEALKPPRGGVAISSNILISWVGACLQEIERLSGRKPILYTYSAFAQQHQLGKAFGDYLLWLADYREGPPTVAGGHTQYTFHQYLGDTGRQVGVEGPCDKNRFRGSLSELKALAKR